MDGYVRRQTARGAIPCIFDETEVLVMMPNRAALETVWLAVVRAVEA